MLLARPVAIACCVASFLRGAGAALDPNTEFVADCRHGDFYVLTQDRYVSRALREYGEWSEAEVQQIYAYYVKPGSVVLDVGANIGAFTVPLAKLAGRTGVVHAFEPLRTLHHLMTANAVVNGLFNVRAHQAFVGAPLKSGTFAGAPHIDYMMFNNYGSLQWSQSDLDARAGTHEVDLVPSVAIDELGLWGCVLMKIDVEGAEVAVLTGAQATIDRFRPAIYLEAEERNKGTMSSLRRLADVHGYKCFSHRVKLYNPDNHRRGKPWPPRSNQGEDIVQISSHNALCVHADDVFNLPPALRGQRPIVTISVPERDEL